MLSNLLRTAAAVLMMVLLTAQLTAAQSSARESINGKYQFNEREVGDLVRGIHSENPGLKKSSIYLAGSYQIKEVVEPLVTQLENEKDPETRVLIALVLYRIGDLRGMEAVENLAAADKNPRVRRMSNAILQDFDFTKIENPNSVTGMLLNAQ